MTWHELDQLLDSEQAAVMALVRGQPIQDWQSPRLRDDPDRTTFQAIQQQLDDDIHSQAIEACQYFAKHRFWPPLHETVHFRVWERLAAARDLVRFVYRPLRRRPQPPEFVPVFHDSEALISWLLVDYWRFAGIARQLHKIR